MYNTFLKHSLGSITSQRVPILCVSVARHFMIRAHCRNHRLYPNLRHPEALVVFFSSRFSHSRNFSWIESRTTVPYSPSFTFFQKCRWILTNRHLARLVDLTVHWKHRFSSRATMESILSLKYERMYTPSESSTIVSHYQAVRIVAVSWFSDNW